MLALSASTAPGDSSAPHSPLNDSSLAHFAELVKETELRRRVNVLYPNPQSIFDGLQAGYVGVRHGNLTFRRRDLVSGTNALARFTRVYDSRARHGRDFGPGWRLSLDEELTAADGGLVYADGSGARHFFRLADSGGPEASREALWPEQRQLGAEGTPISSAVRLAEGVYTASPPTPQHASTVIEVAGSVAVLRNGEETRVFERAPSSGAGGSAYRLSHLASARGEQLSLSYRHGLLSAVSDPSGVIFSVTRNASGRIASVVDRWGRQVHYLYDAGGRLAEAQDIAGNPWRYEYAPRGGLTRAIGPNGRDILRVRYDGAGRVKESLTGRQYAFTYAQGQTIVVEGTGHSHVFGQNAAGITVRFDSTNGVWWRLRLDEQNRVVEAHSSAGAHQYEYGREGQIARTFEQLPQGSTTREFERDAQSRITGVASSDGTFTAVDYAGGLTMISGPDGELSFDTLPSGRIGEASRNQTTVRADYDSEGQLSGLRKGERSVEIDRGPLGRASAIRHADGTLNTYEYDALGNRAFVSFGFGGTVRYAHDPSGNIVEVEVEHPLGGVRRQAVEIGDMNRVESIDYIGAGRFEIGYDAMGRAVSFRMGGDEVLVEYEGPNRIGRIVSKATGAQWSPGEGAAGSATSSVADARLELLHRDSAGAAHADYGIVAFDETTFGLAAGDPVQRGVPGLREARRLLAVAEPLFSGDGDSAMMAFEKPSNPVFQPLEYRSTNCCINIPILPAALVPGGGPQGPGNIGIKAPSFCVPYKPSPPPPPGISVSAPPGPWYIDRNSNMPTIRLTAALSNVDANTANGLTYSWTLETGYGQYGGTKEGSTSSLTWQPNWGADEPFGGDVTVKVSTVVNGKTIEDSRSGYAIHGLNPTASQLQPHMGDPWFFAKLVRAESSCMQFYPSGGGLPRSDGGGYGLTQLTNPAPEREHVWNWTSNLDEAKSRLGVFKTEAGDWWKRQHKQWEDYNTHRKRRTVSQAAPPPDRSYGSVTFGYQGGGKRPLSDGIWIKLYNGAQAHWIVWENKDWAEWKAKGRQEGKPEPLAYWEYNEGAGYVGRVANAAPCP